MNITERSSEFNLLIFFPAIFESGSKLVYAVLKCFYHQIMTKMKNR